MGTPDDHEWWCPFGIQVEIIKLNSGKNSANSSVINMGSRKSSSSSRKHCKEREPELAQQKSGVFVFSFVQCPFFSLDNYPEFDSFFLRP